MPTAEVRAVLLRAAEIVERGWCQRLYENASGYCAVGAIIEAAREGTDRAASRACTALERFLGVQDASRWNDAPGRTQAEVVEALRKAAGEGSHD